MHAKGIIKQRLAYVSGGAAIAEEVTPKPGAKNRLRRRCTRRKTRKTRISEGWGPSWLGLAIATAKKETPDAAKNSRIIWGAVAKTTGDPRAAPFVDLCRSSEQVYITSRSTSALGKEKRGDNTTTAKTHSHTYSLSLTHTSHVIFWQIATAPHVSTFPPFSSSFRQLLAAPPLPAFPP